MRIDAPISQPDNVQTPNVKRAGTSAQPSPSAAVSSSADQAQLSADSSTVRQLQANLSKLPEIRQDRVDALRQAMSSGSYQVSDQQLGDAIASDVLSNVIG